MSELDLQGLSSELPEPQGKGRQIKKTLVDVGEIKGHHVEMLQDLLEQSNVKFASVADKVTVEFPKFVKMVLTHDLEPLLMEEQRLREEGKQTPKSFMVVSSDLLTDISNCEMNEEDPLDSMNVLSGIFVFGMLMGLIVAVAVALVLQFVNFSVETRDLIFILVGSIALILIPAFFFLAEPYLRGIQRRHNEFFHRVLQFFNGGGRRR